MSMKKLLAAGVVATTLATAVAPTASAETTNDDWKNKVNPDFQQGEAGSSLTGSTPLDMTFIIGGSIAGALALLKLVVDNVPALRAQVDEFAAQVGLAGSSGSSEDRRTQGALDFDLERLARTNGFPEIADQLAALKAGSSVPAQ